LSDAVGRQKKLTPKLDRQEESEGVIVGVGISLADIDDRVIIKSIEPGSSAAENGGISEGDQICLLDHVNITGIPADNLATMLLGEVKKAPNSNHDDTWFRV
jgi:C-terminal processing protease CtpA/Prc